MSKKYRVGFHSYITLEVEADNEDEAIGIAKEDIDDPYMSNAKDLLGNAYVYDIEEDSDEI